MPFPYAKKGERRETKNPYKVGGDGKGPLHHMFGKKKGK